MSLLMHGNMSDNRSDSPIDNTTILHSVCVIPSKNYDSCALYSFLIYGVLVGLLCVLGTVGNVISFVVYWSDRKKTSSNFLFQALSLVDTFLLVSVFPIYPLTAFVSYTGFIKGYLDLVHPYILVYILPFALMAQTATIWLTVLVAIFRYIAVCKPYQAAKLCTVTQARKHLAVVLIFAIFYNLPKFFAAQISTISDNNNSSYIMASHTTIGNSSLYHIIYSNILYLIFLLILPLLVLTLLNIRLIKALDKVKRKRLTMQSLRQQQDNNITFVLIIVVLVFTVCQSPALVNQILWNALPDCSRLCGGFQFFFSRISNALVILNSSVNFIIYYFFNPKFRQVLGEYCFCCRRRPYFRNRSISAASEFQIGQTFL